MNHYISNNDTRETYMGVGFGFIIKNDFGKY